MKKKTKTKLILLIIATIFLYSSSITTSTVAQDKSITITSWGCVSCSLDYNEYHAGWSYSGDIPNVAIYLYNLSMTVIEYVVTAMTSNLGSYEWNMPVSHQLDGEYNLAVCDYNNNNIRDVVEMTIYPIQIFGQPISGYPILLIGLIIGITSVIAAIPITKILENGKKKSRSKS